MPKKSTKPTPDTVITLTLPGEGGVERTGTLIIRRGELALVGQFQYSSLGDIAEAIGQATEGIIEVVAAPPPSIIATEDYKPDLEAKRRQLLIDTPVRTSDGQDGTILPQGFDQEDHDLWPVDVGRRVVGYYRTEDLTIRKPQPTSSTAVDPATVKGDKPLPQSRPATDVAEPGQLTLF